MKDMKNFYLPNLSFNEKLLQNFHSKSNKSNKLENKHLNSKKLTQ